MGTATGRKIMSFIWIYFGTYLWDNQVEIPGGSCLCGFEAQKNCGLKIKIQESSACMLGGN